MQQVEKSEEDWINIAGQSYQPPNFSNVIGAFHGKDI